MWRVCLLFLTCYLQYSVQKSTPQDSSYVAAVVEYQVLSDEKTNLQNYVKHIIDAAQQHADIIVFPEATLTIRTSVNVPIYTSLREQSVPALRPDLYSEFLVNISAAARVNEIYVVVNLIEELDCTKDTGEYCPEEKVYRFNTNVVFDRTGAVIDRYRKINLFGEFSRTPALMPDLGVFTTDFGVTFGHFICFDLMFQVPSIQVVEKHDLTDVIFPTMWFSELPYLTAVQIQEAYAYAMNVNLLGAGANNVRVGSAGSGIYSGKAGALVSIMPGVPTTRLMVSRVPKVPGKVNFPVPGPIYDNPSDHDGLSLIVDLSLPSHTMSAPLVPGYQRITLVDKDVSCTFSVRMSQREGAQQYKYRAAVFDGVRSYSGVATGGIRVCGVYACTGDRLDSCGIRFEEYKENSTALFEELSIAATVPTPVTVTELNARDSAFFPISLDVSIMPLQPKDFTYSVTEASDTTVYNNTLTNKTAELYTFAVWGRLYGTDGQDPSPPLPDSSSVPVLNTLLFLGPVIVLFWRLG